MICTMTNSIVANHDDGQVHKQNDQLDRINKKEGMDRVRTPAASLPVKKHGGIKVGGDTTTGEEEDGKEKDEEGQEGEKITSDKW